MKIILFLIIYTCLIPFSITYAYQKTVSIYQGQTKMINEKNCKGTNKSTKQYYFVMELSKQKLLLQKIAKLHQGELLEKVIKKLGKPDYDTILMPKEPSKNSLHTLEYCLKKYRENGVNEKIDQSITLEFDREGRLQKYHFRNIDNDKLIKAGMKLYNNELLAR
jgi:hypothetical protein